MNARQRMIAAMIMFAFVPVLSACADGGGGDATPGGSATPLPEGERMVDVGGYALALRCDGQGPPSGVGPTVVFESGAMPFVDVFEGFRQDAGERWRACSYDRAGTGKSEAGPTPRDAATIADELDRLLTAAGERPPYVLAPYSAGALYTLMYARRHPEKVAGIVMIDPRLPAYQLGVPPVLDDPEKAALIAQLPAVYGDEYASWSDDARVLLDGPLPDVPVVVLTANSPEHVASFQAPLDDRGLWVRSHEEFVGGVRRGKHVLVDDAGHLIFAQNPEAVLDAIAWVVERARG